MMAKRFEGNDDWIERDQGRIATKGAKAAERASAGLGTTDIGASLVAESLPLRRKTVANSAKPDKR
jgi:hypothetical protein